MKKSFLIIAALVALLAWRESTRADAIAQAVQSTSDELLTACESKIDEILGQF